MHLWQLELVDRIDCSCMLPIGPLCSCPHLEDVQDLKRHQVRYGQILCLVHVEYCFLCTSRSCERCIFSREGHIFCYEVFFGMYLTLALEVYNMLFIDILGFTAVDTNIRNTEEAV